MKDDFTISVANIRSQNPLGFGGCIFTCKIISASEKLKDKSSYLVVKADYSVLNGTKVEPGQWWQISGITSEYFLEVNGLRIKETQIKVSSAFLTIPSGVQIVDFLVENPAFQGIGSAKAKNLWNNFGDFLYNHLDSKNIAELSNVLTPKLAEQTVDAWKVYSDKRILNWLIFNGIKCNLAHQVLQFLSEGTLKKLGEDPYRLLSFCASWTETDAFARNQFNISETDEKRLSGAIEEACYRLLSTGHTFVTMAKLMYTLQGILGNQNKSFLWRSHISLALENKLSNGSYVIYPNGIQSVGALVMEQQVSKSVAERINFNSSAILSKDTINDLLHEYESLECIKLNLEQRNAVQLAAKVPLAIITGGAGVGKTTVLKALHQMYEKAGMTVIQLALAGLAAKRMKEATGRHASTIASFLLNASQDSFDERSVVIVDEASMVDIIAMSHLCEILGPLPRIVLVGDPEQIMPVGPGLVLHALTRIAGIPKVHLNEVKRYGEAIATAASCIRNGHWPQLPENPEAAIAFIDFPEHRLAKNPALITDTVLSLYKRNPSNTQILCTKRNGIEGAKSINNLCQSMFTKDSKPIQTWNEQHDEPAIVGIHLGDPVLCTRNLWDCGLRNGSLGVVVQVEDKSRVVTGNVDQVIAWVKWDDDICRPVTKKILDDIELGYAITVHKAQGSQWSRVIVVLSGHRLLDRSIVYTAVTRARNQVLLVGDEAATKHAVECLPKAATRQIALDWHISQLLSTTNSNVQSIAY